MNLTILGGIFKGIPWPFPEYRDLRPTSVMLRRRVFDKFQNLHDRKFIDLCCGTGLMGIEALSRGCEEVYLVEKDRKKTSMLERLIQNSKSLASSSVFPQVVERDVFIWLTEKLGQDFKFFQHSVIYFDPPYELTDLYEDFFHFLQHSLNKNNHCFSATFILIEYDQLKNPKAKQWTFQEFLSIGAELTYLKQGQSTLAILKFP